ncbi:MAG TPA: caspase family protein, partial [Saprospiraceae bacterium]|nr:caspase family protein [Saprospiraceae bacterium]
MKGLNQSFRYLVAALLLIAASQSSTAQCISGNCQNGTGTYRYSTKVSYTGRFVDGQRQGKGKITMQNGDVYEGMFLRNRMAGEGTMTYANGDRYAGQWSNDQRHGKGKYYFKSRERYEGDFVFGEFEGQGTMYYPDGSYYTGSWKQSRKNGAGRFYATNGNVVTGTWAQGKQINVSSTSSGTASSPNKQQPGNKPNTPASKPDKTKPDVAGLRNCGTSLCNSGRGYYDYPDGSRWVGEFKNGYPAGRGICYYAGGDRYEGEWANNAPYGEGIMYFASGRVHGAVWVNGSPVRDMDSNEEVPSDPIRSEASQSVKIWAVVVGVSRYTAMPSLKFTDDDAYRFYTFLRSVEGGQVPENQISILVDEDATRENILKKMREQFLKADQNDVVLLYFSGHGLDGCFLPMDFDGYNNKLRHEEIKKIFQQSKAKHKLCIADACHSGSLNYGNGNLAAKG